MLPVIEMLDLLEYNLENNGFPEIIPHTLRPPGKVSRTAPAYKWLCFVADEELGSGTETKAKCTTNAKNAPNERLSNVYSIIPGSSYGGD